MTISRTGKGFTLVELMAAVAVIAVGMVFVLGALNQCVTSLAIAQKTITACSIMNAKISEIDSSCARKTNGSEEGTWSGVFGEGFNWTQEVRPVSQDFGNETAFVQESLNEENIRIAWMQGKAVKDIVVSRFVRRKRE